MGKETLWKAAAADDWEKIEGLVLGKKKDLLKSVRLKKRGQNKQQHQRPFDLEEDEFGVLKPLEKTAFVNLDERDSTGCTPLIVATLQGSIHAVKCLIAYGANVDAQDTQGNTALHLASWQERDNSAEVFTTLLHNNAKADIANNEGITPLHIAAQTGCVDIVMSLVDRGCDIKALTRDNDAPLDIAVRYNHEDVVAFLLNHDISVVESTKALREACRTGKTHLVHLLLDMGMDVAAEDPETKDTALHIAIQHDRLEVAELLLKFGADAYQPNANGLSALEYVKSELSDGEKKAQLLTWFQEYKDKEVQTPAIVLNERRQRKAQQEIEEYKKRLSIDTSNMHAEVRVLSRWCEDTKHFRSSSKAEKPVTNLLSDDHGCEWEALTTGRQWIAFELPNLYTVTAVSIAVRPGPHVPKDVQLEVASGLQGPWQIVKSFDLLNRPTDTIHLDPITNTMTQKFSHFSATSQYWRLHILRTYGSSAAAIANVKFYGFDALLPKWFAEHGLTNYLQQFIDIGVNQIKELERLDAKTIKETIKLPGHMKKFQLALSEMKGEKSVFDRLVFSRPPAESIVAGDVLPLFEVQANPGADKRVELIVNEPCFLQGSTVKQLITNGNNPSLAYFDDIVIAPPGKYSLVVRSVDNPSAVYAKCTHKVTVEEPRARKTALEVLFSDYSDMLAF